MGPHTSMISSIAGNGQPAAYSKSMANQDVDDIAGIDDSTLSVHLEPIHEYLADESVSEIVINNVGEVLLERANGWEIVLCPLVTTTWCEGLAMLLRNRSNQDLREDWPLLGARLPGGLRVQIVIPPAIEPGKFSFTIRRPAAKVLSLKEIIDAGAFDTCRCEQSALLTGANRMGIEKTLPKREQSLLALFREKKWEAFFTSAVEWRKNIVSSGSTGSGKTTLGNALAALIPMHERVITVEDTREIRLPHHNQVNLEYKKGENGISRLKARDLLEATLRMRPDRVLLAELRGDESFFFIQNVLNSGHSGTITTVHASSAKLAFGRLALLVKGSPEGAGLDLVDINSSLQTLIDIVVQMERVPGGRRIVSEVYFDPAQALCKLG